MLNKLLVPLDGSATSERALAPAFNLARPHKAQVILLHSLIPVYTMPPVTAGENAWVLPESTRETSRRQAAGYLASLAEAHANEGVELRTLLVEGDEAAVILNAAEAEGVAMIVMSAFGYSGTSRWSMGSVTEKVLHGAPCPVLVMRTAGPIREIVVTLDGSELAETALEPALGIACALNARVTLLRVSRPPVQPPQAAYMEWVHSDLNERLEANLQSGAAHYLREVAEDYADMQPGGRPIATVVSQGPAVDEILDYVAAHNVDLIAL
ncbi:MAG TPA: universal stress protein, partial [Candidatus Binatia bacterium]|nr:universal stress protein [Candidatus Binatia bacterium]